MLKVQNGKKSNDLPRFFIKEKTIKMSIDDMPINFLNTSLKSEPVNGKRISEQVTKTVRYSGSQLASISVRLQYIANVNTYIRTCIQPILLCLFLSLSLYLSQDDHIQCHTHHVIIIQQNSLCLSSRLYRQHSSPVDDFIIV